MDEYVRGYGRKDCSAVFDGVRCPRQHKAKGYCQAHWKQFNAGKEITPLKPMRGIGVPGIRNKKGEKKCNRCLTWKPLDKYTTAPKSRDGLHPYCNECHNKRRKEIWDQGADGRRRTHLRSSFKITLEFWEALFESQDRKCAICRTDTPGGTGWATDHDHSHHSQYWRGCESCIRGILCNRCNFMLGNSGDSIDILHSGISYLRKFQK